MAFVRSKSVKGHKYYQLVENYRDKERNGKHRQRVIYHLGKFPTVRQKLRDLRTKEAGERRAASERTKEVEEKIEEFGREIIESQEGPLVIRKPVDDPVFVLVDKALGDYQESLGLPRDYESFLVVEFEKIISSVAKQTGLRPSEVESRWREDADRQYEEYRQRCVSVGKQSMPSREEMRLRYRDYWKRVRKLKKERNVDHLTPQEKNEVAEQLTYEWGYGFGTPAEYHTALASARAHETKAEDYQAKINDLQEIQQKYF